MQIIFQRRALGGLFIKKGVVSRDENVLCVTFKVHEGLGFCPTPKIMGLN